MRRAVTRSRVGELRRGGRNDSERIGGVGGRLGSSTGVEGEKGEEEEGRPGYKAGPSGADTRRRRVPRALARRSGGVACAARAARPARLGEEGARGWGPTGQLERGEREIWFPKFCKMAELLGGFLDKAKQLQN